MKTSRILIIFGVLILIADKSWGLAPQGFLANETTPTVTSDNNSGSAINGNPFTLNGSSFGVDWSQAMGLATFEGGNLQVNSGFTNWSIDSRLVLNHGTTSQYGTSLDNAMLIWNHSGGKNNVSLIGGDNTVREDGYVEYTNVAKTYNTLYFYLKRMRTFDNSWSNWKTFRLFNPAGTTPDYLEVTPAGQSHPFNGGSVLLNATNETIDSGNNGRFHHAVGISSNAWNVEQFIYKQSGGDNFNYTSDGDGNYDFFKKVGVSSGTQLYYHFVNGAVAEHNEAGIDGNKGISDILIVDNYEGCDSSEFCIPSGNESFMDDVVFATGAARVILATSSVLMDASKHHWAFGNQTEFEKVTFWSSTSVVFTAYSDTFTAGQTVYAYVFDSSNNANASGYAITWNTTNNTNLSPTVTGVTQTSFTVLGTSVPGVTFIAVLSTNSFSTTLSSMSITSMTFTYTGLSQGTSYQHELKISTEGDNGYTTVSTMTNFYITNLNPSIQAVAVTSFTVKWTNVSGATYILAVATSNDFSNSASTLSVTSNTVTIAGLNNSTNYFSEVKISTEVDGAFTSTSTTTTSAGSIYQHLQFYGTFNLNNIQLSQLPFYLDQKQRYRRILDVQKI